MLALESETKGRYKEEKLYLVKRICKQTRHTYFSEKSLPWIPNHYIMKTKLPPHPPRGEITPHAKRTPPELPIVNQGRIPPTKVRAPTLFLENQLITPRSEI